MRKSRLHTIFYYILLFTGFRKTEALTLEWKNVHADHIHLSGTYFVGLHWFYTAGSGLFSHVGQDAEYVVDHLEKPHL